ncbi:MAG: glycosyltransferase family 2 protein [Ferruginibacter sp.]
MDTNGIANEGPLVSVLMTCYNREAYIANAIESVLNSTFTDFELIIVDDGSKDNSVAILRSYEQKDKRVKVYQNEVNLGDYPNRNKAASYANGKYIKYVDADDYLYPHGLEQMLLYMEQYDDVAIGLFGLTQDNKQPFPLRLEPKDSFRRHYIDNIFTFGVAPLSTIIRRDIFEAENGFSNRRMVGDFECWVRLSAKYPIAILPVVGCWYRKHDAQEINHVRKFLGDYHSIAKHAFRIARDKGFISEAEFKMINKTTEKKFLRMMANVLIKRKDFKLYKHNLESSGDNIFNLIKSLF